MTGDDQPLALRPGLASWEDQMWARAAIALVVYGTPPAVPLLMPAGTEDMIRQVVADVLAEDIHPGTP